MSPLKAVRALGLFYSSKTGLIMSPGTLVSRTFATSVRTRAVAASKKANKLSTATAASTEEASEEPVPTKTTRKSAARGKAATTAAMAPTTASVSEALSPPSPSSPSPSPAVSATTPPISTTTTTAASTVPAAGVTPAVRELPSYLADQELPAGTFGIQTILSFLKTQKIMRCVVFDVSSISIDNDYTIVLSVPSSRAMQSLSTRLYKLARDSNPGNAHLLSVAEDPDGLWNVVDLSSVWVHVMVDSARSMPACQRVEVRTRPSIISHSRDLFCTVFIIFEAFRGTHFAIITLTGFTFCCFFSPFLSLPLCFFLAFFSAFCCATRS